MSVDFHLHSSASDGGLTPSELVDYAVDLQLECLALTDHNTTRGIAEAEEQARNKGIRFIAGIEMTALQDGEELHILGYFIDPLNPAMLARSRRHRERVVERLAAMVEKLRSFGIRIPLEDVLRTAGKSLPGRPHLAKTMVAAGYVNNAVEAFDVWLGNDGPVFLPVDCESPEEVYALIAGAGGIGGVAHPGVQGRGRSFTEKDLALHREWGAELVEVFHPGHNTQATSYYLQAARKVGLTPTGGSDFHDHSAGSLGMALKPCPSWVERELRERYAKAR